MEIIKALACYALSLVEGVNFMGSQQKSLFFFSLRISVPKEKITVVAPLNMYRPWPFSLLFFISFGLKVGPIKR